jgi:hypothetical protein
MSDSAGPLGVGEPLSPGASGDVALGSGPGCWGSGCWGPGCWGSGCCGPGCWGSGVPVPCGSPLEGSEEGEVLGSDGSLLLGVGSGFG